MKIGGKFSLRYTAPKLENLRSTNRICMTHSGAGFMTGCTRTHQTRRSVALRWLRITENLSMADVFTKTKRSEVMSRIRGRGNKETELALAKMLRKGGVVGWRRNQRIFGKPDFVFREARLIVFVDGCFWHACPKHSNMPVNNRPFWKRKMAANQRRDRQVNRMLRKSGWRVIRIWEHDLPKRGAACVGRIKVALELRPSTSQ
jgi:DNA mismatch endonuclease, patch repair protein